MHDDNKRNYFNEIMYRMHGKLGSPIHDAYAGITFYDPNYDAVRARTVNYSIEYVYESEFRVEHGEDTYVACPGDVLIMHPGCYQHVYPPVSDPAKRIWLVMPTRNQYIQHLVEDYGLKDTVLIQGFRDPSRFENCLELIRGNALQRELEFEIHRLIADLSDYVESKKTDGESEVENVRRFLDACIRDRIRVSQAYYGMGYGKTQAIKKFTEAYGMTPKAYLISARIAEAKRLLEKTDMTVGDIAADLAFNDIYHFSNTFRKQEGMSPLQYRKIYKKENI